MVRPLAWWHFVLLIGIAVIPEIVDIVANYGHFANDLKFGLFRSSELVSYSTVFVLPFYLRGGSFSRLALSRAFANANTSAIWIALVPAFILLVGAVVQLRSLALVTLDNNLFQGYYRGRNYSYTPKSWFFIYGFSAIRYGAFAWIAILALTQTHLTRRRNIITALIVARTGMSFLLMQSLLYLGQHPPPHLLRVSSRSFYVAEMLASVIVGIILMLLFEKAFRPTLVPIVILAACQFFLTSMFESPVDLYFLVSQLVTVLVVWIALRNSKWSSEKWAEYQERQEVASLTTPR